MESDIFRENLIQQTPSAALIKEANNITNDLVAEEDPDKIKDLTALFELNLKKKNIARVNKLSNLLEIVDDEVINRLTSEPEEFDNALLLKYMESTQRSINEIENNINQTPLIQINNQRNEINVTPEFTAESRKKILDVVNQILSESNVIDTQWSEEEDME